MLILTLALVTVLVSSSPEISLCSGQFRGQKGLGPREISLENGKLSGFPAKKINLALSK
jgi:hypothetical protein